MLSDGGLVLFGVAIFALIPIRMVIKENKMNKKYRDEKSVVVKWDSWSFPDSYDYQKRPSVVVECYRNDELFYVWYGVTLEEFKSVPIGAEIEIKKNWEILEVEKVSEDSTKTILSLR